MDQTPPFAAQPPMPTPPQRAPVGAVQPPTQQAPGVAPRVSGSGQSIGRMWPAPTPASQPVPVQPPRPQVPRPAREARPAPVAWPVLPLNAGTPPVEVVAAVRQARRPTGAALPVEAAVVSASVTAEPDEPSPVRPSDDRPGDISGPIRAAAAMVGVLLVGAALGVAVADRHSDKPAAPAPVVAVFHSSDRDMNRFWRPG